MKVRAAMRALDREQDHVAINTLHAFIYEVRALVNAGILTPNEGQDLINGAEFIIQLLMDFPVGDAGELAQISENVLPTDIGLHSAYPNPFNSSTNISFGLPEAGFVELTVFDVNGRLVSRLVNGVVSAGSHNYTFDAKNLESGIYLVKLSAAGETVTQKISFVK